MPKQPTSPRTSRSVRPHASLPAHPAPAHPQRPNPSAAGLAIAGPIPLPGIHPAGSWGARYWNNTAMLVQAASVWQRAADRPWLWHTGATLPIRLAPGPATYDRTGLSLPPGARPDQLCHAIGHATLDALRPDLWDAAGTEVAAVHRAFASITAQLAALELPHQRAAMLAAGLAAAPATEGFAAAFPRMLALQFRIAATGRGRSADAALRDAAHRTARLFLTAVRRAAAAPNFRAQVASELVLAATVQEGPAMTGPLRAILADARLLAPSPALSGYDPHEAEDGTEIPATPPTPLPLIAMDAATLGLDRPLLLQPAAQPPRLAIAGLTDHGTPLNPPHPAIAAYDFAADLLHHSLVAAPRARTNGHTTHHLLDDGRTLRLLRTRFLC